MGILRASGLVAASVVAVLALSMVGCSQPASPAPGGDPVPSFEGAQASAVDQSGGQVATDKVKVSVPSGAVDGAAIKVTVGKAVGESDSGFAKGVLGEPVRIEHDKPLQSAVTIRWSLDELTPDQAASVQLVRWDEELLSWRPSDEPIRVEGNVLTVDVKKFSIVDWIFGGGMSQQLGEFFGARSKAPTCASDPLPSWVRNTVDPDEGQPNAAILTCFEHGRNSEDVAIRVVNNRTFSQMMTLTAGDKYAQVSTGSAGTGVKAAAYSGLGAVINSDRSVLIPPGSQVTVDVTRPAAGTDSYYSAEAVVNGWTMFADAIAAGMNSLSIGGTENPVLDAFLQVMYECAGGKLALDGSIDMGALTGTITGCAAEIDRPDSQFGTQFEKLSRKLIAKGGLSQATALKANRAVKTLAKWAKVLAVAQVATYLSDQIANASVGPLSWGVYGTATPQKLGQWQATCSDVARDASRLYQNIALQDEFADTSTELRDFPTWRQAGQVAIQPLRSCDKSYQSAFAENFPPLWGDPAAAQILADLLRADASRWLITAEGIGPVHLGDPQPSSPDALAKIVGAQNLLCTGTSGFGVLTWGENDTIDGISIIGESAPNVPITESGITIGSTSNELRALGATDHPWGMADSYSIFTWTEQGATMTTLVGPDGTVEGIGVGAVMYYLDYC